MIMLPVIVQSISDYIRVYDDDDDDNVVRIRID